MAWSGYWNDDGSVFGLAGQGGAGIKATGGRTRRIARRNDDDGEP